MNTTKLSFALIFSFCFLLSCASTTVLRSPTGGKIYVDGMYLGEDSVSYTDRKIVGSTTVIEIKKPGFKDKVATINRSGQLNPGALVGGILLSPTMAGLLFFLWILDYNSQYVFDLEPVLQAKHK